MKKIATTSKKLRHRGSIKKSRVKHLSELLGAFILTVSSKKVEPFL